MSQEPEIIDSLDTELDGFFDDECAAPMASAEPSRPLTSRMSTLQSAGGPLPLYLDLETIPDESRQHLFDLPPIPDVPPERDTGDCPPPEELLKKSLDSLGSDLLFLNPCHQYLNTLAELEGKKEKPRGGVKTAINAVFKARQEALEAGGRQRKQMSVTPEMCQIVAIGWAVGGDEVRSLVVGEHDDRNERDLLEHLWELMAACSPVIGYNVAAFDLAVIKARSIILDVQPTRMISDAPYNNRDVCDLMTSRFGRGQAMRLKQLAKLYGIELPAGDVSGGDVERLFRESPEKLGEYVRSDVIISRELHRKFSGYFC